MSAAGKRPDIKKLSVTKVYNAYRKASNGLRIDQFVPFDSLTAASLERVLKRVDVKNRSFMDLGCGDGRVLFSALALGATSATGYELVDSAEAHRFLVSVTNVLAGTDRLRELNVTPLDVNSLTPDLDAQVVYCFIDDPDTQDHVIKLCANSGPVKSVVLVMPDFPDDIEDIFVAGGFMFSVELEATRRQSRTRILVRIFHRV
jgi:SAM-dependent methyltransferase